MWQDVLLRQPFEFVRYHSRFVEQQALHDYEHVYQKVLRDLNPLGFGELQGKQVLDLGCGQRFAFALLCAAAGAVVTALDVDYVAPDPLPTYAWRVLKHNGPKRALKSLIRRLLFDRRYYRSLERACGEKVSAYAHKISFVTADRHAKNYALPGESFDLIVANAVVEHVVNVELMVLEIHRLLKREGFFHAIIHNFYSLSGGHNVEWAYPDESPSSKVPPWDHLRENRFPSRACLNRFKPQQYREAFGKRLEVMVFEGRDARHDPDGLEGERFLTPELAAELSAYPRELLLTRAWCIICRKPVIS